MTSVFTRRRMITGAGQLSALAAAATVLPPNVQKLMAQSPRRAGSLGNIKHVVLLMQENRSFDHYFGTMAGVRGFGDPSALMLSTGRNVFHQPDPDNPLGYTLPFHLDSFSSNAQRLPSTSHAFSVQHEAWNGGKMDQWLPAHRKADGAEGPYTMGYFEREDLPFHRALAEAFTICDAYHSSVMGPTWPNRLFYLTGMNDPEATGGGPVIRNKMPAEGFQWKTYVERLEEAGVSWRVYQHGEPGKRAHNMYKYFGKFLNAPAGSPLAVKGMPDSSDGEFEYDARHDRLPAVSWLYPGADASEHPHVSSPAAGAAFIASKLEALAANPDVWAKTAFILNYDENDGLFDHVPPPVPRPGEPREFIDGVPFGAGFRVPCIVISPWTVGGWVCSQNFDHTSILQFLEKITGVREPNISPWRRGTFGDLTAAFRFDKPASRAPLLPGAAGMLNYARYAEAHLPLPPIPGANQQMPVQESGKRKRAD